jgi:dTDP-4-amino-4,6-dideoxygalactose transaminase
VEDNWNRRKAIWERYMGALSDLPVCLPAAPAPDSRHGFHLFTIQIDVDSCGVSRDDFLESMNAHKIGTGVHYLSIPEHPYYQERFGWTPDVFPSAKRIGRTTVSLPLSAKLSDSDVDRVIASVKTIIDPSRKP